MQEKNKALSLQVLISTINQKDYSLLDRMNIQSDVVVVNQIDRDEIEEFTYNNYHVKWISMSKRGIGLSRNTALMHASADIILFADDDLTYRSDYKKNVISAFDNNCKADMICFNINLINSIKNIGGHRNNTSNKRLHFYNSLRYGACLLAARRKALLRERIAFSLLFGGGAEFYSGEDSLFILDCIKAGLVLYSNKYCLADVDDSESTWYKGINDKLFIDRGMLYACAFPKTYFLIYLYYSFRMRKLTQKYTIRQILKLFFKGKKARDEYR